MINDPKFPVWVAHRQRARTDLLWLCTTVLGYKDIEKEVHGPIIDHLQKFPGGKDFVSETTGKWRKYEPYTDLWHLKGPRKRLILYPRGHLKTTIITMAHTIQWIINYPDIRILLSSATGDQVRKFMNELKSHFQFNSVFFHLFPEFCPERRKSKDFGNQEEFTVLCRKLHRKEPTVSTCSVGKVIAGAHMEVHKNTDLVDKENVKTPMSLEDVNNHFKYLNPLLERGTVPPYHGWTDVEGTPYDFMDLYSDIREREEKLPEDQRVWSILVKGAEDGNPSLWPKRFPPEELAQIRRDVGEYVYACQYLCNPIPRGEGLATREQINFIPRKVLKAIPLRVHTTIDLHGLEQGMTSDRTVFTTAGFDNDARMNILDIRIGRFTPHQVIDLVFLIQKAYRPLDFKIEKDAHARVLLPFLIREMAKRREYPVIVPIPRDTRVSKKSRIWGLQAWFQAGIIRFAEDLDPHARLELQQEVLRFSSTSTYHDDILDTLADQMQNREGGASYDLYPDLPKSERPPSYMIEGTFQGFDPWTKRPMYSGDTDSVPSEWYHQRTGL